MTDNTAADAAPAPHPLLGELIVIPPRDEAAAVVARMRHWNSSLKPWDHYECWLSQDVARETIRLERLHQEEIVIRQDRAIDADPDLWHQHHRDAAEALADTVSRQPARVLAELRLSMHGCQALARRWEVLLATLDSRGALTPALHDLALDLLGITGPLREAITPLDAPAGADTVAHLRSVCATEIARHQTLASRLTPRDDLAREALRLGLGPDTPALSELRKEERAADRRLAWCRSQYKTSRPDPRPIDPGDLPNVMPRKREAAFPLDDPAASSGSPPAPESTDPRRPSRGSPNSKRRRA